MDAQRFQFAPKFPQSEKLSAPKQPKLSRSCAPLQKLRGCSKTRKLRKRCARNIAVFWGRGVGWAQFQRPANVHDLLRNLTWCVVPSDAMLRCSWSLSILGWWSRFLGLAECGGSGVLLSLRNVDSSSSSSASSAIAHESRR